jgi:hypothetical protein
MIAKVSLAAGLVLMAATLAPPQGFPPPWHPSRRCRT